MPRFELDEFSELRRRDELSEPSLPPIGQLESVGDEGDPWLASAVFSERIGVEIGTPRSWRVVGAPRTRSSTRPG